MRWPVVRSKATPAKLAEQRKRLAQTPEGREMLRRHLKGARERLTEAEALRKEVEASVRELESALGELKA